MARRSSDSSPRPTYYPVFLDLRGKQCVVVGGGKVAERKVLSLLRSGAGVTVISPSLTRALNEHKAKRKIAHVQREYRKGDLENAFLVIAATSDDSVNAAVSGDARCMVNVVDKPELADFIVPSLVRRGPLAIAVSTSGASPAMAKAIRRELEALYGNEFGRYLGFLRGFRKKAAGLIRDKKAREDFLKDLAAQEVFAVLRGKGSREAQKRAAAKFELARRRNPKS